MSKINKYNKITLFVILSAFIIVPLVLPGSVWGDIAPAPASIGSDVPLTYFGPAPSEVQKELIGPYQLLKSGKIDKERGTITLPLYEGRVDGVVFDSSAWFVALDTTDKGNAEALGINWSPKLAYANIGNSVRTATLGNDFTVIFDRGKVDFSPKHEVVPGDAPNEFPPKVARPGSVGDRYYSPLVRITNAGDEIYNLPVVASNVSEEKLNEFCDGNPDYDIVHDKVMKICPRDGTVTLKLTSGFSFARPVLYLSTEANDPLPASLEGATYAPALKDVGVGGDDSLFSAVERIFVMINGPTGIENPQRQGIVSALRGEGGPLNVLGGIPTIATDYSPLWDMNVGVWTDEAVEKGYRSRVLEEFQILGLAKDGWITGPGGAEYGSTGFIVNCPIAFRFL